MGFPKKCVEEFGTFVHLELYSRLVPARDKFYESIRDCDGKLIPEKITNVFDNG